VLLHETIEHLNIKPDGVYIDATLGGGGHASHIAAHLRGGLLVGVDKDDFAIERASVVLAPFSDNVRIVKAGFDETDYILEKAEISRADGVLMDVGVSSFQLDDSARGFSYNYDAPLDMRMDKGRDTTAFDVVNGYSEDNLSNIFHNYGEEKWARRIAKFIVDKRADNPINSTFQLVDVIRAAIPKAARADGPHPAKRVFQAIRIEVNDELGALKTAVKNFTSILNPGGRICVITFHSLEDRLVKNLFRDFTMTCTCPRDFPVCICNTRPVVKIVTKKPVIPSENELSENHRARSAKLRVAEKI